VRLQGGGVRELASGVDALYLSGRASLRPSLLEHLAHRRELADGTGCSIPLDLGSAGFGISGRSLHKYRFRLEHPHGVVGLTPSTQLPAIWVQLRAEYLHGVGPRSAVDWIDDALAELCGPIRWSVSRLDLHADFQGWGLTGDDRHRFLARASLRDTHEDGRELTGFEFGRRKTQTTSARIYDKVAERGQRGLGYLEEIWQGYAPGSPVHRVEFEFGREGLRQFDIDSPDEALDARGSLWSYGTHEWLTFRSPTEDRTPSRWPIAPEWVQVQRAAIGEGAAGLERLYAASRKSSLRAILPQLVGYLASTAFHLNTDDIEDTCAALPSLLRDYELISGEPFRDRIAQRRRDVAFS
jgi:hypothetical protein